MDFLSNLFLAAAAIGAAAYCFILSRRLSALSSLEGGMGSAIAVLSTQVDDLTRLLKSTRETAGNANSQLTQQTQRAENVAKRLELLVASMHDLPPDAQEEADREPTRWPVDAAHRPSPEAPIEAPARARVLRRRREVGGQQ